MDKNTPYGDFPGGPVAKIPLSSAGVVGLIPGLGTKIPHAVRQQEKLLYCSRDPVQQKKEKKKNPQETNKTHSMDISPMSPFVM